MSEEECASPFAEGLLEQLERGWSKGRPPDLSAMVADGGLELLSQSARLAAAEIDLEWRWRQPRADRPTFSMADYRKLLDLSAESCDRLLQRELLVRTHWGDHPDLETVVGEHHDAPSARRMLLDLLAWRFPMSARLQWDEESFLRIDLPHRTSWGRQTKDEVPPPAVVPASDASSWTRIIFARRDQTMVSRQQFFLNRVAPRQFHLSTAEASVVIAYDDQQLPPGSECIATVPFVIRLHHWSIRIEPK